MAEPAAGLEAWLADVEAAVVARAPDLLPLFGIYGAEARHGRALIASDLQTLPPGACLLEVGAGSMLLSCQLAREGFRVTALEPTASGFSHFSRMQALVLELAQARGIALDIRRQSAESLDEEARFDFAFSINVMEHVDQVEQVLARVSSSLRPGGSYRFTCPNYLFPYEPHFDMPTLFSKRLTERALGRRIRSSTHMPDPQGMWRSLNWITVPQVRSALRRMPGVQVEFRRDQLAEAIERVARDADFAARRSGWMRVLLSAIVGLRLHGLFIWVPVVMQPIIDCRVTRRAAGQSA